MKFRSRKSLECLIAIVGIGILVTAIYVVRRHQKGRGAEKITLPVDVSAEPRGTAVTLTTKPASTQSASLLSFEAELAAARAATTRDEQVEHLRRAVELKPGDPGNLAREFEIGVLLGQRLPARHGESLVVFEEIVKNYDHQKYYRTEPENSASDPQLMVPRAAILAANMHIGLSRNAE